MLRSKRLYVNILVFGLFLLMPACPWYVPFIIACIALWYLGYYEIILLGFLIDIAYASASFFSVFSHYVALPFTILAAILVYAVSTIQRQMRFQS